MPAARPIPATSVAGGGGTLTADLDVRRVRKLTVISTLFGTATTADMPVSDALLYDASGALVSIPLPAIATSAVATDGAGNIRGVKQYDVSGVEKVRLRLLNSNVGALNGQFDVFMEMLV